MDSNDYISEVTCTVNSEVNDNQINGLFLFILSAAE